MNEANNISFWSARNTKSRARSKQELLTNRWQLVCEKYLPLANNDSIWRMNRLAKQTEPSQGWKLHISATVLEACDLFESVAPFLTAEGVQFKAPKSLTELSKLNSGLHYRYVQVGKIITVYPESEKQAVQLARKLHNRTKEFIAVRVPFDEQFLPGSSVFYRYGAFTTVEKADENGNLIQVIKNSHGEDVPDDRFRAVPEWVSDPFRKNGKRKKGGAHSLETPLETTYRVFKAITQRGKGGTYQALDLSGDEPRLCVVKEGRRYGEIDFDGQDGYSLLENEWLVLNELGKVYSGAPSPFSSFDIEDNFYLAMEYVEGKNLNNLLKYRERRLSIRQIAKYAVEITRIVNEIHEAGWIWNDCKPGNLIVTGDKTLRPVDFEGSYPIGEKNPFNWKTKWFSKPANGASDGKSEDVYAIGAVLYFLLTGNPYDPDAPVPISKFRRNVPKPMSEIVEQLLAGSVTDISGVQREFHAISDSI